MEVFTRAIFTQLPDGTDKEAVFTFEPLARGFGTTIGNAICRTLLADLPGSAVIGFEAEGLSRNSVVMKEIEEDVTRLKLNMKALKVFSDEDDMVALHVEKEGPCTITAADVQCPDTVEMLDPQQVICTVKEGEKLNLTLYAASNLGYKTAPEIREEYKLSDNVVTLDTIFTPIRKAEYLSEPTLLGNDTKYDKVTLEVETNGTLTPLNAVVQASKIIMNVLDDIIPFAGLELEENFTVQQPTLEETQKSASMMIEDLDLSVRSYNCLKRAGIATVEELTQKTEDEMNHIKNLGKKSMQEVKEKMAVLGLSFRTGE